MEYLKRVTCTAVSIFTLAAAFSATPDPAAAGPEPVLGDIIAVAYDFCPRGWASAEGQLLPISSNTALFSLLVTTYGGDGRTTFGLPDLRGRIAASEGNGPGLTSRRQGAQMGTEGVVLSSSQLPAHSHDVNANNLDGDKGGPGGKVLAAAPPSGTGSETIYSDQPATRQMSAQMIATSGGSAVFNVQDPYLVMRYCIAIEGIYPSRN
ncbi:MAG: microcystin-dependent protein [Yoonia sp.]|jgi:microcystin-dependent protein